MTKIKNIIQFRKDNFFDGAVQSDWFYDEVMRTKSSESFIFHGPKYYGMNQDDVNKSKHKLIDTASFTKTIYRKLYEDDESSRFILTIAGYGAGKSHLSVTLASLLSGIDIRLRESIIYKLIGVDETIGNSIAEKNDKNLVIVINGMNDFNLNNELLKNAKSSLRLYGLDDSIFEDMMLAFKTARSFVENTFDAFEDSYRFYASKYDKYKRLNKESLKDTLIKRVFEESDVYDIINEVYKDKTSNYIKWEEGISASAILGKLHQIYVIQKKIFKGIIILFDEFGRYLEYAAAHPNKAGESAIQQIFEVVQNCKPTMLFVGFIQSDLSAYLSRVNNQNIARYVSRYENSDKYYLSSNLETVLANLIKKKDENSEQIIDNIFNGSLKTYGNRLFKNMNRWMPDNISKSVWNNNNLFNQTILRGCYPVHPMTVSLLSSLSVWMQQRSTLSFVGEIFSKYENEELEADKIPYIYPTKVIESRIFNELINAEEKGRRQSQECIAYNELLINYEEKISDNDKEILRAILILNISKYKIFDKADNVSALTYSTGMSEDKVKASINNLENNLGIIYFDGALMRYGFIVGANSKVDFDKEFLRKRLRISSQGLFDTISDDIKKELMIYDVEETPFGIVNNITTGEWSFNKRLIDINDFDSQFVSNLIVEFNSATHPDMPKGNIVFLYSDKERNDSIHKVTELYNKYNLEKVPVLLYFIYDEENIIKDALIDIRTLSTFTNDDHSKFKKYINLKYNECLKKLIRKYLDIVKNRHIITSEGVSVANYRLKDMCTNKFESLYKNTLPFVLDGFEKKVTPTVRKRFNQVVIATINKSITKENEFLALDSELKNRIKSVFDINSRTSWKVLLDNYILTEPNNSNVKLIYDEVIAILRSGKSISVEELLRKYLYPPYGANIYSIGLLFIYAIVVNSKNIEIYSMNSRVKVNGLINLFNDDKKDVVRNLFKLRVVYNEHTSDDQVKNFIEEVNRNYRIENCEELLLKAKKLKEEQEITEEFQGIFVNIESQLSIGAETNRKLIRDMEEATKEYVSSFEETYKPLNYIKIYNFIGNIQEGKIPRTTYYYSAEYIEQVNKIKANSIYKITEGLEDYLNKIKYTSENINNIKIRTKQLISILKSNGQTEFAESIDKRINAIENKVKQSLKYEVLLQKCDSELEQCKDLIVKYNNFNQAKRMIEYWEDTLDKLPDDLRIKYLGKWEELKLILVSKQDELILNVTQFIEAGGEITEKTKLISYKKELEKLVLKGVPKAAEDKLEIVLQIIADLLNDINVIETLQMNSSELEVTLASYILKYEKSQLSRMIKQVAKDKILEAVERENLWREKYLYETNRLNSMNSMQLIEWKNKTQYKPFYLTEKAVDDYKLVEEIVNKRLMDFKIENIVHLFSELDVSQKKDCLEKLEKLIKL